MASVAAVATVDGNGDGDGDGGRNRVSGGSSGDSG